ncbi:CRTAC1 family protein [Chloroflexi bacterium TSY]|nr:CRTAC1 family protein [Chloroflexi bacterium TSY]
MIVTTISIGCLRLEPSVFTLKSTTTSTVPIYVSQAALLPETSPCQDTFIAHNLDHTTFTHEQSNPLFESNGSGLAINDLDNDGRLDIVLANLDGPNAIFWNEGELNFRKELLLVEEFPEDFAGNTRAVNIIDIDGDGWLDIALTHRKLKPPTIWRNQRGDGSSTFTVMAFPSEFGAYSMSWADLDGDNDLDLVTGAYDIEWEKLHGIKNLQKGNGVVYYENQDGSFHATQLTPISQALALFLVDLNEDDQLDILVGNDFFHPDQLWLRDSEGENDGWKSAKIFELTTQNTMSIDVGDVDNNGTIELFAADMKPYPQEPMEPWQPLMANMMEDPFHNDPQIMANVLQMKNDEGAYEEMAGVAGVDGTGWTWSAKFGDLNNDGLLDLYAVNGMVDPKVFKHMTNAELVEENQTFRNIGDGQFVPAPEWNLNATTGGRSMSMADLDRDGDLDIVVNNFMTQAQIFEKRLCGGQALEVELLWSDSLNTRAIGARLTLHTTTGSYSRDVRAASGYLSGDPAQIHFGLPNDSQPLHLEIKWPDGKVSTIRHLSVQSLLRILRE